MFKKSVLTAVIFLNLLAPSLVSAAPVDNTSQLPELNPFCWRREDCYKIRQQFISGSPSDAELEQGFITDSSVAPCVGGEGSTQWGRCLPAGQTKTAISFGGQDKFSNIGEFLVVMYKYLLTIASIVSVVVIILAGAQWITSGGNSEAISSAKKRIAGAVIGLFIAYMSYFILNTINPALVNLRLPQVWLVKPQSLTPEFCGDIEGANEGKLKFMLGASQNEQTKPITRDTAEGRLNGDGFKWTDPKIFACGSRAFVESGGNSPCRGRYCLQGLACWNNEGDRKNYECGDVRIGGRIANSAILTNCGGVIERGAKTLADLAAGVVSPWDCQPVKDVRLMPVCEKQEVLEEGGSGGGVLDTLSNAGTYLFDASQYVQPRRLDELQFGTGHDEDKNRYHVTILFSDIRSTADRLCGEGGTRGFILKATMTAEEWGTNETYKHYVGKGGVDLGGWWFWRYANKIDKRYLFTLDEIEKGGVRQDFDANDIALSSPIENYEKYLESKYIGRAKEFYGPLDGL